jgi:hypothetical protein
MDPLTTPKPAPETLLAWLLSILSEKTGHGSWARVQAALAFAFAASMVAVSVITGHDIQVGAQAVLLGLLAAAGVGYSTNVGSAALATRKPEDA